jgi:hypothetical protein
VVFEEIGEMAGALSYVHVSVSVDLMEIETQLNVYEDMVKKVNNTIGKYHAFSARDIEYEGRYIGGLMERYDKRFVQMAKIHLETVESMRTRLNNLKASLPHPTEDDRQRRGVISAVVGTFMGLYNRYQLRRLKEDIQQLRISQNQYLTIVRNQEAKVVKIENEVKTLQQALAYISFANPAFVVSSLIRTENRIREALDSTVHFVQQLQVRRLAVDFLNATQLNHVFNKAQAIAILANYRLIPEHPSDLFQTETSYYVDGTKITAIIHVPVAPRDSMLRLFRFKPFPLPLDKEVALIPKVEADVLALSHGERFSQELKFADLMDCHVINKVYLCDKHGIVVPRRPLESKV